MVFSVHWKRRDDRTVDVVGIGGAEIFDERDLGFLKAAAADAITEEMKAGRTENSEGVVDIDPPSFPWRPENEGSPEWLTFQWPGPGEGSEFTDEQGHRALKAVAFPCWVRVVDAFGSRILLHLAISSSVAASLKLPRQNLPMKAVLTAFYMDEVRHERVDRLATRLRPLATTTRSAGEANSPYFPHIFSWEDGASIRRLEQLLDLAGKDRHSEHQT